MQVQPDLEEFLKQADNHEVIAVSAEFTADAETPLSAYAKLSSEKPAFLFESVVGGEQVSRFSFVGFGPRKTISCGQTTTEIMERGKAPRSISTPEDPLKVIEDEFAGIRYLGAAEDARFSGGAVGYVSYEYANRIEPSVSLPEDDQLGLPLLFFMIADLVLIFDHACQTLSICANAYVGNNPTEAYQSSCSRIEETIRLLNAPSELQPAPIANSYDVNVPPGNISKEDFEAMVEKTKDYVRSGDVIQTVLSQRFSVPFTSPPINLYRAIRAINPSPYMFLMESDEYSIVGASPVHVRLTKDDVLIRPIAGTRPRGKSVEEDELLEKDLLADEKEKAEHLMLVDLARNDIGRVCEIGSVQAAEYMNVERYSHVMHIVSQVIGKLRPDCNAFDLIRATFPAGTVSGAPKVRAMQIISEFEKIRRNAYAGALGYFGYEGNHDSCIAIRTAMITNGVLHLQAGAGIVADSIPEKEYEETINKAKGMLNALALAERISV